ncbi:alpha/beta hydrolase [Paenibacillus sp. N1-5-1-14]|nr:alpha/beta hydrolase [Paenibacillus radicibacter]MCR8641646.1 alpha/beta hydrolase [Paenibacillus radicibacter]
MPRSKEWQMVAKESGREYRIFVASPSEVPPPSGFPVIYMLDGNAIFGTMVEAVRVQSRRPEKTGVTPAVIVGIGYPTDEPFNPARFYDFTMPTEPSELPKSYDGSPWPEMGGAESFFQFIEQDLKPRIESMCNIDKNRQSIWGHSLGGLFVLQTLFNHSTSFQTYIAGSPSIHWNKSRIREMEQHFTEQLKLNPHKIDLLITAGELEQSHPSRMNEYAKALAERLFGYADCGMHVEYKEFEGEGHVSVLPGLISRTARFAFQPLK